MGLQKYKRAQWHDDALLFCSDGCACIFVKYLQDGFTIIQTHEMTRRCVAFFKAMRLYLCKIFARWVYKNTNARNDATMRCFFVRIVCIFVKYLQDGFTKIQTRSMTRRCVAFLFGWMRLYLCKIFARWVYNNTNALNDTTMRCFFVRMDAFWKFNLNHFHSLYAFREMI